MYFIFHSKKISTINHLHHSPYRVENNIGTFNIRKMSQESWRKNIHYCLISANTQSNKCSRVIECRLITKSASLIFIYVYCSCCILCNCFLLYHAVIPIIKFRNLYFRNYLINRRNFISPPPFNLIFKILK